MKHISTLLFLVCFGTSFSQSGVQTISKSQKGIEWVAKDSIFSLRIQFRVQSRAGFLSKSDTNLMANNYEMRVRRLRLRLEGFVYNPKLTYKLQFGFSRGDMDWDQNDGGTNNTSVNIIRDAMFFYEPIHGLKFGFGQGKLPGNRQRVVSSGDQQFYERSIVNAKFNIDRDFGFFAAFGKEFFNIHAALSSGEGRNSVGSNSGLCYTVRTEVLPFGKFTGKNDYIEGDLEREQKPKVSIGFTYNFNDNAVRAGGQLGRDLYSATDITTYSLDMVAKYKGWAIYLEYMNRDSDKPITSNFAGTAFRPVYVGYGFNSQLSYNFKNNFEIATRYANVTPFKKISTNSSVSGINELKEENVILGVSKYLNGHRLKVQLNALWITKQNLVAKSFTNNFGAFFQVELGI